jgi:ribosomal protein L11 methyltransferase
MNEWIEVIIETSTDAGELLGMLGDPDVSGGWQENGTVRLYWPAHRWSDDTRRRLEAMVRQTITVHSIPSEDWNARWTASVQPFRLGRRLVIRPSWHAAELRNGDIELIIDPKEAFGTGHHATTQLLLEWLEDLYSSGIGGTRILDAGTGSGILAMAALRFGARSALGIDTDATAIGCAKEYAETNGFGTELKLREASLNETAVHGYDLVIANLDRRTILESIGTFKRCLKGGASLLISGLLGEDRDDIARAFSEVGGAVRSCRERDGWIALEIREA